MALLENLNTDSVLFLKTKALINNEEKVKPKHTFGQSS